MPSTPDWQLERYRPLLRLQVRQMQLDPRLRRRFDSSDLVQETLLRAYARRDQFEGQTEPQRVKWLQTILKNVAIDEIRKAHAKERDVARERSLEAAVAESSAWLEKFLAADQSSPSEQARRNELVVRVTAAIDQLPEDQRDVVIQRDLMGRPVAEIAAELGRTEKSVAGLLLRGRRTLRELLADLKGSSHGD